MATSMSEYDRWEPEHVNCPAALGAAAESAVTSAGDERENI
ncbi:hypothetical protein ACIA8C_09845 [Nocardia sp. NPDC051321]